MDENQIFRFVVYLFPDKRFKIHFKTFITDLNIFANVPIQINNGSTTPPLLIITYLLQ